MNNNCNLPILADYIPSCGIQPEDYNCNLTKLINIESCIGAAVYTINSNFSVLDSFLNNLKKNILEEEDIINQFKFFKDKWEEAYTCVCSNSANWIEMYEAAIIADNTLRVPVLIFYPQVFESERWHSYTAPEKNNIFSGPVTRWINDMYPATEYPLDAQLVCCILIRGSKVIEVTDAGTGTCPTPGFIIDKYTTERVNINFNINTSSEYPQWKM